MLKGVLHCHSTYSDGDLTLVELREIFVSAGCRFLCITDHAEYFDAEKTAAYQHECEQRSDDHFRFIAGLEYRCTNGMHVLGYGTTSPIASTDPQEVFRQIGLAGGRQLRDVEARVADRRDPGLEQRPLVPLRQRVAKRLLEHRLAPHPLHHEGRRHLAPTKPGNPHLAAELARRALDPLLDGVGIDADVEADAAVGELGDRGAHGERER